MSEIYFATPDVAEQAFYAAFEQADLDAMMAVWSGAAEVVCVHPMGPVLRGREAIAQSWAAIFATAVPYRFQLTHHAKTAIASLAVHSLHEHIDAGDQGQHFVIATNVYQQTDSGWSLCLHHGSPGRMVTTHQPTSLH